MCDLVNSKFTSSLFRGWYVILHELNTYLNYFEWSMTYDIFVSSNKNEASNLQKGQKKIKKTENQLYQTNEI